MLCWQCSAQHVGVTWPAASRASPSCSFSSPCAGAAVAHGLHAPVPIHQPAGGPPWLGGGEGSGMGGEEKGCMMCAGYRGEYAVAVCSDGLHSAGIPHCPGFDCPRGWRLHTPDTQ